MEDLKSIIVNTHFENAVDTTGETLIPPTLKAFAHTFSNDLSTSLGLTVPVKTSYCSAQDSIYITISNSSNYVDAAGRPTSEGYSIDVTSSGIVITGASPLGAWWATRTILQQAVLDDKMNLDYGSAIDAPGWGVRGVMVSSYKAYSVSPADSDSSMLADTFTLQTSSLKCAPTCLSSSRTHSISI